ncbi:FecR family protein [Maribellus sp. CM-23]|uniref:FecR family protein n=1 Tax=Maribellus sp. CM-23 TaxID=2781026 RepID=UPI001F3211A4|nr:FecR family protein [Maribellus sp. CM-23]MCE4566409.1 FecR family protein [Maribellus sp. CM-23]
MKNKLDVGIIWKKIHRQTNDLEEKELASWMKNHPERQEFYKKTSSYFETGSQIEIKDIDVSSAKKKIYFQLFILPKLRFFARGAAVFIGIAVIAFLFNEIQTKTISEKFVKRIEPGSSKATLILSDGSRHTLEEASNKKLKEKGTIIISSGKQLNYEALSSEKSEDLRQLTKRYNTLNIPRGGEFFLSLSDGTKVWLNAETRLSYPIQFEEKERKVELIGEAYFEVTPHNDRPFRIVTNGQVIEVLGTSFNVNAYPDEDLISTTLVEGSVKIKVDETGQDILLEPGFQCRIDKSNKTSAVSKVNVLNFIAWKDGDYVFDNETLEEMMSTLSRWYDFTYSFENNIPRQLRFDGKLKRTDKFEEILTIIENTNEVKFKIEEKNVIIY